MSGKIDKFVRHHLASGKGIRTRHYEATAQTHQRSGHRHYRRIEWNRARDGANGRQAGRSRGACGPQPGRALEAAESITSDESNGGVATFVAADVSDEPAVRRVAEEAVSRFGRIDTWVNGAGVSVYGRLMDVSLDDQRRLFETNFWGVVIGSRVAVPYLRNGGALINIGSILSDRAVPLQGSYCE